MALLLKLLRLKNALHSFLIVSIVLCGFLIDLTPRKLDAFDDCNKR